MKKMLYLFSICLVLHCFMSSCDDDTIAPSEFDADVTIYYSACWTTDLLEFVVPVVTYTDFNGEHELDMPEDDCKLSESGTYYEWKKLINLKKIPLDNSIIVQFERIDTVEIDPEKNYYFNERLGVDSVIVVKGRSTTTSHNNETIIKDNYYKGQKAEDYLNELCKTPHKVRIMINDKLEITKEK